jgi:methionyl-tRNA formyltransferase
MRLIFFGDGIIAEKCLLRLLEEKHEVIAVIARTVPTKDYVIRIAHEFNIPVQQPISINSSEFLQFVATLEPDLNICVAHDQIFKLPLIHSAKHKTINAHTGQLPYYRGRNGINWVIINGEKEIGLTIHFMDEGIDTGDIILQDMVPILWTDYYQDVVTKIESVMPASLIRAIRLVELNKTQVIVQKHQKGTYFSKRILGDEWIDWSDTSVNIYNKIRAISRPCPHARTLLADTELLVLRASYNADWPKYIAIPGMVVSSSKNKGIEVKTGDSTIFLEEVQAANQEQPFCPQFAIGTRLGVNCLDLLSKLQMHRNYD